MITFPNNMVAWMDLRNNKFSVMYLYPALESPLGKGFDNRSASKNRVVLGQ